MGAGQTHPTGGRFFILPSMPWTERAPLLYGAYSAGAKAVINLICRVINQINFSSSHEGPKSVELEPNFGEVAFDVFSLKLVAVGLNLKFEVLPGHTSGVGFRNTASARRIYVQLMLALTHLG